jgi:putative ABC transport system permease protein
MNRHLRIIALRLRSLWRGGELDRELDDELRDHVDRQVEANIAAGMTPEVARRSALLAIGGVERRKDEMRDARGISVVENLLRDLRLAVRQLRKQPGFTATAILSLALGIGANTAIFQLLNALSLRTLPVAAPQELVEVRLTGDGRAGRHTGRNRQVSLPQYQELARRQQAFSSLVAFGDTRFNLSPQGEIRYVDGLYVSGNFFSTLGVPAAVGRLIGPADDVPGCGVGVAVISHALWQNHFGGRADILSQTLPGFGGSVPIIGVAVPGFFGVEVGRQFGVAMPNCASGSTRRDHWWLAAIGRLKPGWTAAQAQSHLQGILPDVQREAMPEYRSEWQQDYLKMGVNVVDASAGVSPLRRSYRRPLWVLMAVAALVLLIASVNLANLLLARASARRQEFSVRLAIGGTRGRIIQQVLTESLLLAALGSIAAIGVALAVARSIPPLISTAVDRIHLDLSLDWRVFGFTALVGTATALMFGLAPAFRLARTSVTQSDRGSAANEGTQVRRWLVAAQIAVTLVLLFGGLLFLRTFRNLSTQDIGVQERNVVVANLFFSERAYPPEKRVAAFRVFDERLRSLPGVESLAETFTTPLGGSFSDTGIEVDGKSVGEANLNRISAGYFKTLGTRVIAGRDFDDRDVPGAPRVAIVTEAFARAFFKTSDVMGRRFTVPTDTGQPGTELEIVGVVGNQKYLDIRESDPRIFFVPSIQDEAPRPVRRYVIRAAQPPAQTMAAITAAVTALDPTVTMRFSTLEDQLRDAMLQEGLMARLSAIFGGVALLLAVVGLYGVVSYTVASRRAEIGVRVALGAGRARIVAMILGDVGRMMVAGVAVGAVLALVAGRAIASLLYALNPNDPATLATAAGLLIAAGVLSAAGPARRAAGIDPVKALRES